MSNKKKKKQNNTEISKVTKENKKKCRKRNVRENFARIKRRK